MASKSKSDPSQLKELLLQALATERGGIQVYTHAIRAASNDDLREEWRHYLEQTRNHEQVLLTVFQDLGLDAGERSAGSDIVTAIGESLVAAIDKAMQTAGPEAAQLAAAECVVLAETKDHLNWELIGHVAERTGGDHGRILKAAHKAVERDEDHHLYHTAGWTRELWIQSLGYPAVLPPPEEIKDVETAIGASRAQQARSKLL